MELGNLRLNLSALTPKMTKLRTKKLPKQPSGRRRRKRPNRSRRAGVAYSQASFRKQTVND
ncbi:hypothetical protein [Bacillus licheniformis]|uniref:hypothetical protein n=1 Tax=Bacillus licheniformis TaxID=1402 RepID=UPI001F62441E|nr:hypothetical protein [Bacillus licheniformis]